jgi:hypothetical protein
VVPDGESEVFSGVFPEMLPFVAFEGKSVPQEGCFDIC